MGAITVGTVILVYLSISLAVALLVGSSVLYCAMYGEAPFGLTSPVLAESAAGVNASTHTIIGEVGIYLGTAIILAITALYSAFVALAWPVLLWGGK